MICDDPMQFPDTELHIRIGEPREIYEFDNTKDRTPSSMTSVPDVIPARSNGSSTLMEYQEH